MTPSELARRSRMASKRNALAELAEEMNEGLDCLVCVPPLVKIYGKAQRIVAELAKVEDVDTLHNLEYVRVPNSYQCYDAVVKCRAIAEEGANHGK